MTDTRRGAFILAVLLGAVAVGLGVGGILAPLAAALGVLAGGALALTFFA